MSVGGPRNPGQPAGSKQVGANETSPDGGAVTLTDKPCFPRFERDQSRRERNSIALSSRRPAPPRIGIQRGRLWLLRPTATPRRWLRVDVRGNPGRSPTRTQDVQRVKAHSAYGPRLQGRGTPKADTVASMPHEPACHPDFSVRQSTSAVSTDFGF